MMKLREKFIILIILIIINLVKSHDQQGKYDSEYNFQPKYPFITYSTKEPLRITTPTFNEIPPNDISTPFIPTCDPRDIFFSFSNVGLRKIGQDFIKSNDIISLSLDNNEINDTSPFAFRSMRNLRYLNLSGNKIPKEKLLSFAGNDRLQTLIINNNNDFRIPDVEVLKEYEIFKSLKHLHICNSNLGNFEVPFHQAAPILTHLYLTNNSIKSSPAIFDNIPVTLTHLNLAHNLINRVEQHKLRYLKELNMDNNSITEICYEICQNQFISLRGAAKMQNLSLAKNMISKISADAFTDTKHLTNLDLSENKISDIAKSTFNNTIHITKLSLAYNSLAAIPEVCPMFFLNSLNLTGNHITAIHISNFCSAMRSLHYLYLADNVITTIENLAFINLSALKYLDLSGNRLRQLPMHWVHTWSLHELHLERNSFTKLNDVSLINIKSLKNVYLQKNPMPSLQVASFKVLPQDLTVHISTLSIPIGCDESVKCKDKKRTMDDESEENDDYGDD